MCTQKTTDPDTDAGNEQQPSKLLCMYVYYMVMFFIKICIILVFYLPSNI